ncbi:MAG TPA: hypothetical protein DEF72_00770 [Gammaproteobacteria bacterium]|nr:hypothetical protein [Gammaproteobacteria bacterium]HBX25940.1 hypothetical protein [Gammaproteobacteria bacterium]
MRTLSPDSIIAPWLEAVQPKRLWVIGTSSPSVVGDYKAHAASQVAVLDPAEICSSHEMPQAALVAQPLITQKDLLVAGQLRNLLIADILCFASNKLAPEALYALAFKCGEKCQEKTFSLSSFHYSLASYNHVRVWNNPKFWANPENWNRYWW